MFKNNKSGEMAATQSFDTNAIDRIAEGTTLEGNVNSAKSIRIDGTVKGTIKCAGRVVVGKSGIVEGHVECDSADVEGTLNSTVTVAGVLELKATAVANGDLTVGKLVTALGAQINGKIDMGSAIKSITGNNTQEQVVEKTA